MTITPRDIILALSAAAGRPILDVNMVDRFAAALGDDPAALDALARQFHEEGRRQSVGVAAYDHSQYGEFRLLLRELVRRAAAPGIVVDAGAKGRMESNSYDLIVDFGWRGVLIEAQPGRAACLREEFGAADYQVFSCAVGTSPGRQPLWLGKNSFIASLDRSIADLFEGQGDAIEVDVRTLPDILDEADIPAEFDLLSIDVEGIDVPVLNQLIEDSRYRPRWIIVEVLHRWVHPVEDLGFSPAFLAVYRECARTLPNIIFERR